MKAAKPAAVTAALTTATLPTMRPVTWSPTCNAWTRWTSTCMMACRRTTESCRRERASNSHLRSSPIRVDLHHQLSRKYATWTPSQIQLGAHPWTSLCRMVRMPATSSLRMSAYRQLLRSSTTKSRFKTIQSLTLVLSKRSCKPL